MNPKLLRGAILADVLIAAFILSVGLVAVVGLFIQVGQSDKLLNHQEQAACFAAEGMERLRHWGTAEWTTANLTDAADSASMQKDGVQFDRTITLRPRPDLDPLGHLLEAEVRVRWAEASRPGQLVLLTYFAVDTPLAGLR